MCQGAVGLNKFNKQADKHKNLFIINPDVCLFIIMFLCLFACLFYLGLLAMCGISVHFLKNGKNRCK